MFLRIDRFYLQISSVSLNTIANTHQQFFFFFSESIIAPEHCDLRVRAGAWAAATHRVPESGGRCDLSLEVLGTRKGCACCGALRWVGAAAF